MSAVASYYKLNCTYPQQKRKCNTENNQKNLKHGRQNTLEQTYMEAPTTRILKSRNPFYNAKIENFNATEEWRKEWENITTTGGSIITIPIQPLPGFTTLKESNRLRRRHAKSAYMMHNWKLKGCAMCQRCSKAPETTDHIVLSCAVTKLDGGYETVHNAEVDLVAWINKYNLEV
ncbi:hypothetical protein ElyMa_002263200 [Elysia marginata]|uniref:Reverse transcriptase zinc-binding domain-containing protein n=1 Tax=Elysia marginata TaxID=1093978 RepID=A0AAV4G1E1_9GAST|nr:hypothetical protein ElyMa_002263200 [Elysia marginata]